MFEYSDRVFRRWEVESSFLRLLSIRADGPVVSVTPGDLNEGFALAPTGFSDVTFQPGHVTVPEPGTALVLLAAGLVTVRRCRGTRRR